MRSQKLFFAGIFIITASLLISVLQILDIFSSKTRENAGIGSFTLDVDKLLIWGIFALGGLFIGISLLILGIQKKNGRK